MIKVLNIIDHIQSDKDFNKIVGFDPQEWGYVYFNNLMQEQTADMDVSTSFSIALSVLRYINSQEISRNDLLLALDEIRKARESFSMREIISNKVNFIYLRNEEDKFDHYPEELAGRMGAKNPTKNQLIGRGSKEIIKRRIVGSGRETLDTTIWFCGHGAKNVLALYGGNAEQLQDGVYDLIDIEMGILVEDLANWLKQREDYAGNVKTGRLVIVIDACFAYNFVKNLEIELKKVGINELPVIVTVSEKNQYSTVGVYNKVVRHIRKEYDERSPYTGSQVFKVEEVAFYIEDTAVFYPLHGSLVQIS